MNRRNRQIVSALVILIIICMSGYVTYSVITYEEVKYRHAAYSGVFDFADFASMGVSYVGFASYDWVNVSFSFTTSPSYDIYFVVGGLGNMTGSEGHFFLNDPIFENYECPSCYFRYANGIGRPIDELGNYTDIELTLTIEGWQRYTVSFWEMIEG